MRHRSARRVLFSVDGGDAPQGADGQPLVPAEGWATFPPAAQAIIVALAAEVAALRAANATLTTEVRALKARLGQNSSNSSRPPSSDPPQAPGRPSVATGRARGGQPGHVAHQRSLLPPARIDRIVDHWPATCGACRRELDRSPLPTAPRAVGAVGDFAAHQVTDVPPVRAVVTEHRLHRVRCPACGAQTRATLPPEVPAGAFGPRLQATVAVLNGRYRLSRREVADVCETLLDTPRCVGSVNGVCQATAEALAVPVAEVVATLPHAAVANADETGWRQAGQGRWLWTVVTALTTVFVIATSRGSGVIKGLLGEAFAGIPGSDRYSAYAWLDVAFRQVCWAHLARDWQGLVDRGGAATPLGRRGVALTRDLFTAWPLFRGGTLDRAGLQAPLRPVQDACATLLDDGACSPDAKAAGRCRALDRLWPAWWTFVDEDGVEPTNNAAERALRPAVLWRKGSFGTQSDGGARFVERLLTVTATCKQQGRSVLDYVTAVCTATQLGQPVPSLLPATP